MFMTYVLFPLHKQFVYNFRLTGSISLNEISLFMYKSIVQYLNRAHKIALLAINIISETFLKSSFERFRSLVY